MKKLSKKQIIIGITALVVLIAVAAVVLVLAFRRYSDPTPADEIQSPYGNFDYSKKPYFSASAKPVIYKNNVYRTNESCELVYASLTELKIDMAVYRRTDEDEYLGLQFSRVCTDSHHANDKFTPECETGWIGGVASSFLIDAYESNGSFPIIYYTDHTYYNVDNAGWDQAHPYTIYRYNTGDNTREALAEFESHPGQMMTYGDLLYVVTQSAQNTYQVNVIDKKSKKLSTLEIGKGEPELLSADDGYVYVNDKSGNVIRADRLLQSSEIIYTLPEIYEFPRGGLGIFINDGYIYFRADYGTEKYWYNDTQYFEPVKYNLRRVPLNDPQGEGELVAEDIFQYCDFGVAGGKLYFAPMQYGEYDEAYYLNFTSGIMRCVDLSTLECTDVVSDSGLMFDGGQSQVVTERCIITNIRPISADAERYDLTEHDGARYITLYDFETGSLYHLYATS